MCSTETAAFKPPKLTRSSNWEVWSAQFEEHVRLKGVSKWLTHEPSQGNQELLEEPSGDAMCNVIMLLRTPFQAPVRLLQSAANATAAWTALKTDVVRRDKVRIRRRNRESREFRQRKGESFMLYCDRSADHLSKVEAVGGSKEQLADDCNLCLSEPFSPGETQNL
jgi:hypothetical protein